MTRINPFENGKVGGSAPVSLDQAAAMLQQIEQGSITVELAIRSDSATALTIPDNTYLRIVCAFKDNQVDPQQTRLNFVDKTRQKRSLSWFFLSFNDFILHRNTDDPQHANLIGTAWLWFIPVRKTLFSKLPLEINALLGKLTGIAKIRSEMPGEVSATDARVKPSVFNAIDYRYQVHFGMVAGSTLELNDGTSVAVEANGNANVRIEGVNDYSVATITGTGVKLDTPLLSTGPSGIDVRVTLNRRQNGIHQIAFDDTTLHEVQFKSSDFDAPLVETLRIDATDPPLDDSDGSAKAAKTYDFIITVNPHDDFTMKTLIAKVTERIGNPQAAAKLRQKLTGESQESSEIVIDSARWSILDYVTHDLNGQFSQRSAAYSGTPRRSGRQGARGPGGSASPNIRRSLSFPVGFNLQSGKTGQSGQADPERESPYGTSYIQSSGAHHTVAGTGIL